MTDPALQLDLFGEVAAQLDEQELREREREIWRGIFERGRHTQPWDAAGGARTGDVVTWVRCPSCGYREPSDYFLWAEHGIDPERPLWPNDWSKLLGRCFTLRPELKCYPPGDGLGVTESLDPLRSDEDTWTVVQDALRRRDALRTEAVA